MKFNSIASAVFAVAAMTTPTIMFGAAADLTDCCTPADKDQPKVGGNLGNQLGVVGYQNFECQIVYMLGVTWLLPCLVILRRSSCTAWGQS